MGMKGAFSCALSDAHKQNVLAASAALDRHPLSIQLPVVIPIVGSL
jgi:hypothetical protein